MALDDIAIQETADNLQQLEPGMLIPEQIFRAIAERMVMPVVDIVPLAIIDSQLKVLMTQRSERDPHFPNMLHIPGTILRTSDVNKAGTYQSAFNRVLEGELKGIETTRGPQLVETLFYTSLRGAEITRIYLVQVNPETVSEGEFFPVDEVLKYYKTPDSPEPFGPIVPHQIETIRLAAAKFLEM